MDKELDQYISENGVSFETLWGSEALFKMNTNEVEDFLVQIGVHEYSLTTEQSQETVNYAFVECRQDKFEVAELLSRLFPFVHKMKSLI